VKTQPTQDRLKELYRYEPDTGNFYHRTIRSAVCRPDGLAGTSHGGRIALRVDGRLYLAHRLAWLYMTGDMPRGVVDHINGVGLDNRWSNLRDVSQQINTQNTHKRFGHQKHSNLPGAHWCGQRRVWKSSLHVDGRSVHLGTFGSAEEASAAYVEAKRRLHPGYTL
jgi:hypothetical protein